MEINIKSASLFQMDIRVVIFEDNALVRDALATILAGTEGFRCVGAFPDGNRCLQNMKQCEPNVVLMDIGLPGMNGIELTQLIHQNFPEVRILIQTVFNDTQRIFQALCAGASGYILKNEPPHKYLEAIKEVNAGGGTISSSIAKKVLGFFTSSNVILVPPNNTDYQLTSREKEILTLMVEGNILKVIADKTFISYETVRTHVKNIYKKLHVVSRSEAILKAIQQNITKV
jgi:DNA-binding NarL/FixJ family response regulator